MGQQNAKGTDYQFPEPIVTESEAQLTTSKTVKVYYPAPETQRSQAESQPESNEKLLTL